MEQYAADFDKEGRGFILKCQTLAGVVYFMDEAEIENCPDELKGRTILIEPKKARTNETTKRA